MATTKGCNLKRVVYYKNDGVRFGHTQAGSPKWERHDCGPITISIAADIPYKLAHEILKDWGRKNKKYTPDWVGFIHRGPFKWRRFVRKPITLKTFCKKHPKGRFVCMVRPNSKTTHVLTVVNGTAYDCALTKPRAVVHEAWQILGIKKAYE